MKQGKLSTLSRALLALLSRGPATGYELSQRLSVPLGYFWSAKHGQIYPEVARLEKLGMVRRRHQKQSGKPDKKIVSMTAKGRLETRAWLTSAMSPAPVRSELALRTHALRMADPLAAAEFYEEQASMASAEAKKFAALRRAITPDEPPPTGTDDFSDYVNLSFGIENRRHVARWCKWVAGQLRDGGSLS